MSSSDFKTENIEGGIKLVRYTGDGGDVVIPEEITYIGSFAHCPHVFPQYIV